MAVDQSEPTLLLKRCSQMTGFPILNGNSCSFRLCRRAHELVNLLSFPGGTALACGNAACGKAAALTPQLMMIMLFIVLF